jgi:hypothetical protein
MTLASGELIRSAVTRTLQGRRRPDAFGALMSSLAIDGDISHATAIWRYWQPHSK